MIVRMCVVCRDRIAQSEMRRLQCKDSEIIQFSGIGRSFYICDDCIKSKKLDKIIQKICKTKNIEFKGDVI